MRLLAWSESMSQLHEPHRRWWRLSIGLAAAGWCSCAYMLLRMVAIGSIRLPFALPFGRVSLGAGCDDFLASPEAFLKGIPLPGLGLVYLALVLFLLALDRRRTTRLAFLLLIVSSCMGVPVAVARPDLGSNALFTRYAATASFAIPLEPSDAVLGSVSGSARLVVFTSFQCDWCRKLAPVIHRLHRRFGDRLTIVFKNFPLGKECNPALDSEMQPRACAAAWAAEAANLQGKFWPYQDRLFAGPLGHPDEALRAAARAVRLDLDRWDRDRVSPVVHRKVMADVQLGLQLGVQGTPAVFLNGRKVDDPDIVALTTLIRSEIR